MTSKIIIGLILGCIIGTILGILSPNSHRRARKVYKRLENEKNEKNEKALLEKQERINSEWKNHIDE